MNCLRLASFVLFSVSFHECRISWPNPQAERGWKQKDDLRRSQFSFICIWYISSAYFCRLTSKTSLGTTCFSIQNRLNGFQWAWRKFIIISLISRCSTGEHNEIAILTARCACIRIVLWSKREENRKSENMKLEWDIISTMHANLLTMQIIMSKHWVEIKTKSIILRLVSVTRRLSDDIFSNYELTNVKESSTRLCTIYFVIVIDFHSPDS